MILSVFVSSLTRGLYRTWLLFFIEFDSILSVLLATFVYFFMIMAFSLSLFSYHLVAFR